MQGESYGLFSCKPPPVSGSAKFNTAPVPAKPEPQSPPLRAPRPEACCFPSTLTDRPTRWRVLYWLLRGRSRGPGKCGVFGPFLVEEGRGGLCPGGLFQDGTDTPNLLPAAGGLAGEKSLRCGLLGSKWTQGLAHQPGDSGWFLCRCGWARWRYPIL